MGDALMVGSLAGVIALVWFTIAAMDHPFSGAAELPRGLRAGAQEVDE